MGVNFRALSKRVLVSSVRITPTVHLTPGNIVRTRLSRLMKSGHQFLKLELLKYPATQLGVVIVVNQFPLPIESYWSTNKYRPSYRVLKISELFWQLYKNVNMYTNELR